MNGMFFFMISKLMLLLAIQMYLSILGPLIYFLYKVKLIIVLLVELWM